MYRVNKYITGNGNTIVVERGACIKNTEFHICGDNHTVVFRKNCSYNGGSIWCEGSDGRVVIGPDTSVVSAHICVQEHGTEVIIGEDCMLSNNIIIRTSDSHPLFDGQGRRLNPASSVRIGDHVWICAKATVMKGVSVGDGAVIGYQSVITKNVPPNALAAGAPARIVRNDVHWTREALF